jgi:hypothetical protein
MAKGVRSHGGGEACYKAALKPACLTCRSYRAGLRQTPGTHEYARNRGLGIGGVKRYSTNRRYKRTLAEARDLAKIKNIWRASSESQRTEVGH